MLGKIICWWKGKHLRGKVVLHDVIKGEKRCACPRCGRTLVYKVKATA